MLLKVHVAVEALLSAAVLFRIEPYDHHRRLRAPLANLRHTKGPGLKD